MPRFTRRKVPERKKKPVKSRPVKLRVGQRVRCEYRGNKLEAVVVGLASNGKGHKVRLTKAKRKARTAAEQKIINRLKARKAAIDKTLGEKAELVVALIGEVRTLELYCKGRLRVEPDYSWKEKPKKELLKLLGKKKKKLFKERSAFEKEKSILRAEQKTLEEQIKDLSSKSRIEIVSFEVILPAGAIVPIKRKRRKKRRVQPKPKKK